MAKRQIDIEQALDHAKEYLRNSAIVCVDEMESSGTFGQKKTLLNALKRIITAGELGHRARYSDYTNLPTLTNYILFRSEDEISLTRRQLTLAMKEVFSSDDAISSITNRLMRELKEIFRKQDYSN